MTSDTRKANRSLAGKLLIVAVAMFGFGVFAMPPLYAKFCEITGIGQAGVRIAQSAPAPLESGTERPDRQVKLYFDATANSAIPWEFKPVDRSMKVVLGAASQSAYTVKSLAAVSTAGRAVYNVTPPEAATYFVKTECFCFSRQELEAMEEKEMPVRFYIKSDLPEDISEITLSYTFFLNEDSPADSLAQQTGSN